MPRCPTIRGRSVADSFVATASQRLAMSDEHLGGGKPGRSVGSKTGENDVARRFWRKLVNVGDD